MNFTIYQDKRGFWRWLLKDENGLLMADSGEGVCYSTSASCYQAITKIVTYFSTIKI